MKISYGTFVLAVCIGCQSLPGGNFTKADALTKALSVYRTDIYGGVENYQISVKPYHEKEIGGDCWLVFLENAKEMRVGSHLIILVSKDGAKTMIIHGK
jgi:hypothetical protein